tara:strand:+ start:1816 stop:2382 length:567 start_codon:yes stop_codon:yes gene_type:complete
MRTNLIVVDDFYKNVDDVRNFALSQKFTVEGNYPGIRTISYLNENTKTNIARLIKPHAGKVIDWLESNKESYSGAFQLSFARHKSWVHTDNVNNWAGVLYLTPNAPLEGGTGFYRSKVNNSVYGDSDDEVSKNYAEDVTKWELVSEVHNRYNRLILFRADQWHTSQVYFGNNIETGRLTQVFFFTTEY